MSPARASTPSVASGTVSISTVKTNVPYYAPFTSNNHRTVSTPDGIFLSYFTNWSGVDGGSSDTGDVVVARSVDGGSTWSQLIDSPNVVSKHAGASMEVDSAGNVYAFLESQAWGSQDGRAYMFPKSKGFANNGSDYLELAQMGNGSNKFASGYDPNNNTLVLVAQYFMAQVVVSCQDQIGTNGTAACTSGTPDTSNDFQWNNWCNYSSCQSGKSGQELEYPDVYVGRDAQDAHVILLSWTESNETPADYYDIRFIFSTDDGATWHGANGATVCPSGCTYGYPLDTTANGPSILVNPSSETSTTDGVWLDNTYIQNGDFLFAYSRCPRDICSPQEAPEYARFSTSGGNASLVNRILAPTCLSTGSLCPTNGTSGGFFSGTGRSNAPIYYTTQQSNGACTSDQVITLVSNDNGATWQDDAQSPVNNWNCPYGVSGGPTLGPTGTIAGAFVNMTNGFNGTDNKTLLDFTVPTAAPPPPPPPPPPPSATSQPATNPGSTTATVNASVNPNGADTHYSFQYGTTTSYGSTTPSTDAGSGTSPVAAAANLTGLAPSTTYHFQAVATSASGTTNGGDLTFTTAAPPPPCTTFTSPATHSHRVCGRIRDKYLALGGPSGFLGYPVTDETGTPDGAGRFNYFSNGGAIYWTAATDAWSIHGAILDKWASMGWERSVLGYPTTDESGAPDGVGRFNDFSYSGSIYWTPSTGARSIHGLIRDKFLALGGPTSFLGYPVTDETGTPDGVGRFNYFSNNGSIYWTPGTGAWSIHGAILDKWASMGWERSVLGYPVTDENGTPDNFGRFNHFTNDGSVYFTPNTGAWSIHGMIRDKWASMGWERSCLSYPVSDEFGISDGRQSNLRGGDITFAWATDSAASTC